MKNLLDTLLNVKRFQNITNHISKLSTISSNLNLAANLPYNDNSNITKLDSTTSMPKIDRAKLEFNPSKIKHISFKDHEDSIEENKGKLFAMGNNKEINHGLKSISNSESNNIFIFGGLDFDNFKHLAALHKYTNSIIDRAGISKFFQDYVFSEITIKEKPCLVFPHVNKEDRYKAAINFNLNKKFYPNYIEEFVNKNILPKLTITNGELSFKSPITFISYSIGGREIYMIENALRNKLSNEFKLSSKQIYKIFENVKAVCIAYAIDTENLQDIRFSKTILFNIHDEGVLIPKKTIDIIEETNFTNKPFKFYLSNDSGLNHLETVIFFSKNDNTFPYEQCIGNSLSNGHSLRLYVEAIKKLKDDEFEPIKQCVNQSNNEDFFHSYPFIHPDNIELVDDHTKVKKEIYDLQ